MIGKLLRLPHLTLEQVNHRLADGQTGDSILKWLNALPEVKALLRSQFGGQPITKQNLSDYRNGSFAKWQMRQAAFEFASEAKAQQPSSSSLDSEPLLDHLVHYILLRFAAAAQNSQISQDQDLELRQIRQFLADIVVLRRGELVSRRIRLEHQRLARLQSKDQQELERLFWDWTKRPEINAQLYPHRDPEKTRRDVLRLIDRQMLGVENRPGDEPDPDPLAYI